MDLQFFVGDVMEEDPPQTPAADIITILNYSIFYIHDRAELSTYLRLTVQRLAQGGILVFNVQGGPEMTQPCTRTRKVAPSPRIPTEAPVSPFDYVWEQQPIDADYLRLDCRIHFDIPYPESPGETIQFRDAFQYDWRIRPI